MTDIKSWSTAAANNNAASPDGAPEGMAPSGVNDTIRECMAAVRRWFESAQWTDLGDVPTRTSATTFTMVGDKTATYTVNRRLKLADASTLYGTITASSFSSPNTTVTVALDSGSLTGSLSAVALGIATPTNQSVEATSVKNAVNLTANNVFTGTQAFQAAVTDTATHTISGAALNEGKATAVASAATTDIWNINGNYAHITGTVTITSFGTAAQAGIERTVIFDGALTLTNNANILCPGGASITTAAGDRAIMRADTTTIAEVVAFIPASGKPVKAPSGATAQIVSSIVTSFITDTAGIPADDTIPQNTEGTEAMNVTITPKASANTLLIEVSVFGDTTTATVNFVAALFQDSGANALGAVTERDRGGADATCVTFKYVMTAGTTSATTFKVRFGASSGNAELNGQSGGRLFGGVACSSIVVTEFWA
jgi:hypothetical protein